MVGSNEKAKGSGLCHVEFGVKNFEKTLNFYIEELGYKKNSSWVEGDKRVALLSTDKGKFLQIVEAGLEGRVQFKGGQWRGTDTIDYDNC